MLRCWDAGLGSCDGGCRAAVAAAERRRTSTTAASWSDSTTCAAQNPPRHEGLGALCRGPWRGVGAVETGRGARAGRAPVNVEAT